MQFLGKHKQLPPDLLRIDTHTPLILPQFHVNCCLFLKPQQCVLELSVEQKVNHMELALLQLLHQHEIIGVFVRLV